MAYTAAFSTLGCKVNQYETEGIIRSFLEKGYSITDFSEKADVYVINSCSVTSIADRKARTLVRNARKTNPDAVIVLCGCYSQTHSDAAEKIPEADIIIGSANKENIPLLVEKHSSEQLVNVTDIMQVKEFEEYTVTGHSDKTRAFMKIQDGCDNYCAYCIIPYARGHIRSRNLESIRHEAELLVKNGYKEIVLTGIHITSYGRETGKDSILDVLLMLHEIEGLKRIRLGSLEYNSDLIKVAENAHLLPRLCNHFHVSVQSGCDETLHRMRRRYTTEEFLKGINLLREAFPGAAVTTDIMVGFPGETREEFAKSMEFAKKAKFSKMHIFPYSIREGTLAAKMDRQLPMAIKKERVSSLEEIDRQNVEAFSLAQINTMHSVLFEQQKEGFYTGHTTNYLPVFVKSESDISKEIHNVLITELKDGKLYGVLK